MVHSPDDVEALIKALREIATMPGEDDEWDAVEKYGEARLKAQRALAHLRIDAQLEW